jgi:two-component system response regulator CpxR
MTGEFVEMRSPGRPIGGLVTRVPLYVRDSMWADRVWKLFLERDIATAPVLDDRGRPIGLVARTDFAGSAQEPAADAVVPRRRRLVRHVMKRIIRVLPESASIAEARALFRAMSDAQIAVVDAEGVMLGTVSRDAVGRAEAAARPPRVLVVDDDGFIRESLGDLLSEEGYDVELADNGGTALAAIREGHPDLVLLDLMMPVLSGWEVLERLDDDRGGADAVPVIVISAFPAPVSAIVGRGVRACFGKPLDTNLLLEAVRIWGGPPGASNPTAPMPANS